MKPGRCSTGCFNPAASICQAGQSTDTSSRVDLLSERVDMKTAPPEDQSVVTNQPWSVRMADFMIKRHSPDAAQWHYEHGLLLMAIERVWCATKETRYWNHVKNTVDLFVEPDG